MLTSILVALAALTAIAPAAAAPAAPYTRRGGSDESGDLSRRCLAIARSNGVARCATERIGNPLSIFGGGPQVYARRRGSGSRHKGGRDAMTMRADDSEALSLSTIGTLVSVAAPVVGGIIDHFTNKQQRDYFMEELLARSILDELD